MIKHPKVDYVQHSTEYYSNQCLDCHNDLEEYPYGFAHSANPEFWSEYQNWGKYYTYPWWWESYWWDIGFEHFPGDDYQAPAPTIINIDIIPPSPWYIPFDPAGIDVNQGGGNTGSTTKYKDSDESTKTKVEKEKNEGKPPRRRMPNEEKK